MSLQQHPTHYYEPTGGLIMSTEKNITQWIDVNEIQEKYLPISKKAIRKVLKENLDIARTGKKILVERQQFLDFLRHEI